MLLIPLLFGLLHLPELLFIVTVLVILTVASLVVTITVRAARRQR